MAFAGLNELKTELRLLDGRLTIGADRESNTLTEEEALYYLDVAHAELQARFGLPDTLLTSTSLYKLARRWEALYAAIMIYRALLGPVEGANDYFEQVKGFLQETEKAIKRNLVSPSVQNESLTSKEHSKFGLSPFVFPEYAGDDNDD